MMQTRQLTVERIKRSARLVGDFAADEARRIVGLSPVHLRTARHALEQWLGGLGQLPPVRGRILITAVRNLTWIEWAVYTACVLRTMGYATTILYRGSVVRSLYREPSFLNFWRRVGAIPDSVLVDLEEVRTVASDEDALLDSARDSAPSVIAYDEHLEEDDVRSRPEKYGALVERRARENAHLGAALAALLRKRSFDRFICYSGLIGESPSLLKVARDCGLETVCIEGWAWRPGHMIYNLNEPALEYNIDGWLRAGGPWTHEREKEIDAYLKFQDGARPEDAEWLENYYNVQRAAISEALPPHVRRFVEGGEPLFVAAPNVIGDSSTLRRETIFEGQQAWARELVAYFRARPHLKLVVRAHPAERWVGSKCVIHMGEVVRAVATGVENVLVIDADEAMNTFALVPFARAGLVYLSSAGVDFVVRGIPTVAAARPKYTGMGIVEEPPTREAYFATLERLGAARLRPQPAQVSAGKRYLQAVFKGFSFEASAKNYRATGLRLGAMPNQPEHDRFYRILVGDEAMPDRTPASDAAT